MMATIPRFTDTPREDSSPMELGRTRSSQAPTTTPVTGITQIPQHRTDLGHHHERNPQNVHPHQNANSMIHLHLILTNLPTIMVHQNPTMADGGDLTTTTGLPHMILYKLESSWKRQNPCSPTSQHIPDTKDLRESGSSPWLMLTCMPITKHATV